MLEGWAAENGLKLALKKLYAGKTDVERDLASKERTWAVLARIAVATNPDAVLLAYGMLWTEYVRY